MIIEVSVGRDAICVFECLEKVEEECEAVGLAEVVVFSEVESLAIFCREQVNLSCEGRPVANTWAAVKFEGVASEIALEQLDVGIRASIKNHMDLCPQTFQRIGERTQAEFAQRQFVVAKGGGRLGHPWIDAIRYREIVIQSGCLSA